MRSSLSEHRLALSEGTLTQPQVQIDAAVATLGEEASNVAGIASIVAGGLSYRASNLFLSRLVSPLLAESGLFARTLTHALVRGSSLAVEVSTFRGVSNGISSLSGHAPAENVFHFQGWTANFSDFLILKGLSPLAAGRNMVFGHFVQANAMVLGHEVTGRLGLTEHRQSSYLQQLAEAEALNMKLALGMSLVGVLTPAVARVERRMEGETAIQNMHRGSLRIQEGHSLASFASERSSAEDTIIIPRRVLPFQPTRLDVAKTHNFDGLTLTLRDRAGYVRSERKIGQTGINFETATVIPMDTTAEYAPFGGHTTEVMRVDPIRGLEVLTGKWEIASVLTMSTALLGLGEAVRLPYDITPILTAKMNQLNNETMMRRARKIDTIAASMGQIIMSGKVKWLRDPAGVSAFPLSYTHYFTAEEVRELLDIPENEVVERMRYFRSMGFARFVRSVAPNFGAINLEDLSLKELAYVLPEMEAHLAGRNALWDDDMYGTGGVFAAYVHSWLKLSSIRHTDRNWGNTTFLIHGAGAGGYGVYRELLNNGAKHENIIVTDTQGVLWDGRPNIQNDPFKKFMSTGTRHIEVKDAHKGIHVLINLGSPDVFLADPIATEKMMRELAEDGVVIGGTNPEPGLRPEQVRNWRPDLYFGSGNSTLENCANNFLTFPHVIGGSMIARAGGMGPLMTREASIGISRLAELGLDSSLAAHIPPERREFGRHSLLPHPKDLRLLRFEMAAVAKAAARENLVIRHALPDGLRLSDAPTPGELAAYDDYVDGQIRVRDAEVRFYRERVARDAPTRLRNRFGDEYSPFQLPGTANTEWEVAPRVEMDEFKYFANELGLEEASWNHLLTVRSGLKRVALTTALTHLKEAAIEEHEHSRTARQELEAITYISQLYPSLGLALALRRASMRPEADGNYRTIFHDANTLGLIRDTMPEALDDLRQTFPTLPQIREE